jgi:predicted lipoprotein with Yx(FWY)xxD motif
MKIVSGLLIAAIVAMIGFIAVGPQHRQGSKAQVAETTAMPAGITFNIVGAQTAMSAMGAFRGYPVITDSRHKTIYTTDNDQPNKSTCTGDCAKTWLALEAPADAKPSGFWTVVTRDDGKKQWARHGKPLYTYSGDKNAGDMKGASVESWHFVLNKAMDGVPLPDGIATEEDVGAGGQTFVDVRGKTLYAYTGDIKADARTCAQGADCTKQFRPLVAPQLASTLGDFTAIVRPDGSKQWAYQSQPLYTYDGDDVKGDSLGRVADPRWHVALAERYFQPDNIKIGINVRGVDYLTDAAGMTLYARDRFHFQVGGFNLRHGQDGIAQLGQFLNSTMPCAGDCLKTWVPAQAPADFQPSGYWSVVKRKDGISQWAFQGYALYTYAGDKKPGDETGHDDFDIADGAKLPPIPQNPIDAVAALYWREVFP